jgi:hypothetical protein
MDSDGEFLQQSGKRLPMAQLLKYVGYAEHRGLTGRKCIPDFAAGLSLKPGLPEEHPDRESEEFRYDQSHASGRLPQRRAIRLSNHRFQAQDRCSIFEQIPAQESSRLEHQTPKSVPVPLSAFASGS